MSVPGPTDIVRYSMDNLKPYPTVYFQNEKSKYGRSLYAFYYNGEKAGIEKYGDICIEEFTTLQYRAIEGFNHYDSFSKRNPDFGLKNCTCLSDDIIKLQNQINQQYKE
jgi:hypothetical protein